MVDKITKALNKLSETEKKTIKKILSDISIGKIGSYDTKKLKGRDDIYRIRKGKIRVIFIIEKNGTKKLLTIERRSDTAYNF